MTSAAVLTAGAAVVAVVGSFVLLVGVGRGGDIDHAPRTPAPVAPPTRPAADPGPEAQSSSSRARPPTARERETGTREVVIGVPGGDRFAAPVVVDELDGRVVLRVRAAGFQPSRAGWVEQCVATTRGLRQCGNRFPVQFDGRGTARFQYLVGDAYFGDASPGCGAAGVECVVRLRGGAVSAILRTVFGRSAPAQRVTVTARPGGVAPGTSVGVSLAGFTAGSPARVSLCAAPATSGPQRCSPAPARRLAIGADGTGRGRLAVRSEVGSDGVRCGREVPCAVVVTTGSGLAAPPIQLEFARGAGAAYDVERWLLGVVLATVLVVIAVAVVRRTDWRKPSEADTPLLDTVPLET